MMRTVAKFFFSCLCAVFVFGQIMAQQSPVQQRAAALKNEQRMQEKEHGIVTASATEIMHQTTPDTFTQSEAHLQVKGVKSLLALESSQKFIPYLDIISDCLVKEAELKDTHYVFYHTFENVWRVAQDLFTQLSAHFNPLVKKTNPDFTYLRFEKLSASQAKEFLIKELQTNGLVDDRGKMSALLLSVNLSLFGNIGFEGECTWCFFTRQMRRKEPEVQDYQAIMNTFGLTHKYINELMALPKLFETKEKTIVQIFVPIKKVDEIGYLSWATGMPAHPKLMQWIREYMQRKDMAANNIKRTEHSSQWLAKNFQQEQERNPLFKDLMESVKRNDYSIDAFLKMYRNNPWALPNINDVQARLIFSSAVLLNPDSGIRLYRYSTASKKQLDEYSRRLTEIVNKIISEPRKGG